LSEAAPTRLLGFGDIVSAALFRSTELISSFIDAARRVPSTFSIECLNYAMVREIVEERTSCASLFSAWMTVSFSRPKCR
jgi:hypothetical protein